MADLKTTYMGLELKNPIIAGANNLVADEKNLKILEQSGVSAIVYKSLFEEQIQLENLAMDQDMEEYADRNAEMGSLFPNIEHAGPKEHLFNLKRAKEAVNIPVIASLNCVYDFTWVEYAQELEKTGVDALELNFYAVPTDFNKTGAEIEAAQIKVVEQVKAAVKIPVAVKLSPFYSNPLNLIARMDKAGVDSFVLFNRLFQPDIDLETETHHFPWNLSNKGDYRLSLRYAGLLFDEINADVCCNTGIFSGEDVIQNILAGADAVQVVSALYKSRPDHVQTILKDLEEWMDKKGYDSLATFRGKLSKKNITDDRFAYKRAQYVDILWNANDIFNRYPIA